MEQTTTMDCLRKLEKKDKYAGKILIGLTSAEMAGIIPVS
jgi:hypothetical protein